MKTIGTIQQLKRRFGDRYRLIIFLKKNFDRGDGSSSLDDKSLQGSSEKEASGDDQSSSDSHEMSSSPKLPPWYVNEWRGWLTDEGRLIKFLDSEFQSWEMNENFSMSVTLIVSLNDSLAAHIESLSTLVVRTLSASSLLNYTRLME